MKMREILLSEAVDSAIPEGTQVARDPWRTFMVYGSFRLENGENFFFVRVPKRGLPWHKKVLPAVNKIVRSFYTKEQLRADAERYRRDREHHITWSTEGIEDSLWTAKHIRYQWDGTELVRVAAETAP